MPSPNRRVLVLFGTIVTTILLVFAWVHWNSSPRSPASTKLANAPDPPKPPVTSDTVSKGPSGLSVTQLSVASNTTQSGNVVSCEIARSSGKAAVRLFRSPTPHFVPPAEGDLVATATTGDGPMNLTDGHPRVEAANFYRVVVNDDVTTVVSTQDTGEVALQLNWRSPIIIGAIGDSLTVGVGAGDPSTQGFVVEMAALLNQSDPFHYYTINNQGISGTKSTDWSSSRTGNLSKAIAAMKTVGVSWVVVMLGSNDANNQFATPVATYLASMKTIVSTLVSSGFRVYLSGPPAVRPLTAATPFDDIAVSRTIQYEEAVATLENRSTVFIDARKLVEKYQPHLDTLVDQVHPNSAGHRIIGQLKAIGILEANSHIDAPAPRY